MNIKKNLMVLCILNVFMGYLSPVNASPIQMVCPSQINVVQNTPIVPAGFSSVQVLNTSGNDGLYPFIEALYDINPMTGGTTNKRITCAYQNNTSQVFITTAQTNIPAPSTTNTKWMTYSFSPGMNCAYPSAASPNDCPWASTID